MGQTHLKNALRIPEIEVTSVADKSQKNQKLAAKWGVPKTYTDYEELLAHEKPEAVIVSLPNFLRVPAITKAAGNGVDVFVDKPLARNLSEIELVKRTIRRAGIRLMVSNNFRFFPHVQELKHRLEQGRYGEIVSVTLEHIMNGPFTHPLVPRPVPEWWFDKTKVGGGALIDNGHHVIDLFTWLFGKPRLEYWNFEHRNNLEGEDAVNIVLRSGATGTVGMLTAGWFSNVIFPRLDFRVILHGTAGYCSTDELRPNFYLNALKEGLRNISRRFVGRPRNILTYTYYLSSYFFSLQSFVECLKTGAQFPTTLDEETQVMSIIDEIYNEESKEHGSSCGQSRRR